MATDKSVSHLPPFLCLCMFRPPFKSPRLIVIFAIRLYSSREKNESLGDREVDFCMYFYMFRERGFYV